ncbi:DJ-1/PfpI family protein [Parathielavia hyrcaniae]|uniref:DJ-1/PfpI family protein n=1 Tax=Parathielavia hyrcaniae TaxID=113614 RepID=A0AAN6PSG5_9PEZI|nr:DJ-1/PfpI family protein [Parathielavia hyrcaniae]
MLRIAVFFLLGLCSLPTALGHSPCKSHKAQSSSAVRCLVHGRTPDIHNTTTGKPPHDVTDPPVKFGMVLFRAFEPLDVFGPIQALFMLSRIRRLELSLIAETLDVVTTQPVVAAMNPMNSNVFPMLPPSHTLETAPTDLDVLIIPGGLGTRSPLINATIEYITQTYPKVQYLITVCTGSALAARAGVLDGRQATTNKASWSSTVLYGPKTKWIPHARWVVDGNIWTSSGISAGIDATLAFIEHAYGRANATYVANMMEYERHEDPAWDPFADIFQPNMTGVLTRR